MRRIQAKLLDLYKIRAQLRIRRSPQEVRAQTRLCEGLGGEIK